MGFQLWNSDILIIFGRRAGNYFAWDSSSQEEWLEEGEVEEEEVETEES
jgi:hypothetical protein